MNFGLGLGLSKRNIGLSASVTASISGLQTVGDYSNSALVGDHAGLTATASEGTISARAWGSTLGGSEYGTGTSPTSYTAGDNGNPLSPGTLYLRITVDGETYDTSAPIRAAKEAFSAQPSFDATPKIGETIAFNEGTATVIEVVELTLGGVDKSGELSGTNWDTTGESAGEIRWQTRTVTSGGYTNSNVITGNLAAAVVSADTSPVMGALSDGAALATEAGTDGTYSSDYPGETFIHGASGATIIASYEIEGPATVWTATTATVSENDVIRKSVAVTGSEGTAGTFTSSSITVSAAGPVISGTFNDTGDIYNLTTDTPSNGNWHYAYTADGGNAVANGSGGWTGTTIATGTVAVGADSSSTSFPTDTLTEGTVYEIFVYQRLASGDDSNVITAGFTLDVSASGNSISSITGSPVNTQDGADEIYTFTGNGSFVADGDFTIDYLIVAGGGAGASGGAGSGAGGGGAGGVLSGTFSVVSGQTYTVTVGSGGTGGTSGGVGMSGGNSGITVGTNAPGSATGGGFGGSEATNPGAGGSGGGAGGASGGDAGGAGTSGQGNAGGTGTGGGEGSGGGGAGAAGSSDTGPPNYEGGPGGAGTSNSITGSAVTYGGGGGGGNRFGAAGSGGSGGGGAGGSEAIGIAGTDGLGGGGGGSGRNTFAGGDGGDGVAIVRFTP